jgi:hypothetical protein
MGGRKEKVWARALLSPRRKDGTDLRRIKEEREKGLKRIREKHFQNPLLIQNNFQRVQIFWFSFNST